MAAQPLLEIRNLKTHFFTRDGVVRAVDGVSFSINEGEALGLVGESGCGKSVSALSIMRLIAQPAGRIVEGEILFDGRNLLELDDRKMRQVRGNEIGMIFQDPMTSLNPVLPIGLQICEALETHKGMARQAARRRATELLELVGIPSAKARLDDYPHQFSGGMRQRVMIAMAISCEPKLLIADEPTTALDVTIQAQILDLIQRLRRELGMSVIMITHDLGVVAGLCDKINVMYAGHIIESSDIDSLFADPRHPYTLGLLRSMPRIDQPKKDKLVPIEGMPPTLVGMQPGCPFAPRCAYRIARCDEENPGLTACGDDHHVACWVAVKEVAPR
jgi:oligopeptide transport system ATP-binding protein